MRVPQGCLTVAEVLVIEPRHAELSRARAFLVGACTRSGVDDEPAARLALAADEVCSNIIDHGGGGAPIELSLAVADRRVRLTVRDEAPAFDPRSIPPADVSMGVDRPAGGLGWHLVLDAVDHVAYRRAGGRNVLTLTFDPGGERADGPREFRYRCAASPAASRAGRGRSTG